MSKLDKREWLRFMNRPPKKEKKIKSKEDDKPVEKIYLSGDEELFAELCLAEEKIKSLKEEIKNLKEHYEIRRGYTVSSQEEARQRLLQQEYYNLATQAAQYVYGTAGGGIGGGITTATGRITWGE